MKTLAYHTMTTPAAAWRKTTWALGIWTTLIVVWVATGIQHANKICAASTYTQACHAGETIGVAGMLIIGLLGFIVLSLIWIMTKPNKR